MADKSGAIEAKARTDFAEYYASPSRVTAQGSKLYFVGWKGQGVMVRRWNGDAWGPEFTVPVGELKRSKACELPGPVPQ